MCARLALTKCTLRAHFVFVWNFYLAFIQRPPQCGIVAQLRNKIDQKATVNDANKTKTTMAKIQVVGRHLATNEIVVVVVDRTQNAETERWQLRPGNNRT